MREHKLQVLIFFLTGFLLFLALHAMAFKLPKLKKAVRHRNVEPIINVTNDLPSFCYGDVVNRVEIRRGSFATVYVGTYQDKNDAVLKVLHNDDDKDGL
jgi:hypothetical protein